MHNASENVSGQRARLRESDTGKGLSQVLSIPHHQPETLGVEAMSTPLPERVHDFGGFPARLHELRYPAAGRPVLSQEVARSLPGAGSAADVDAGRSQDLNLDHGAWVPLYLLFPKANIPGCQVSISTDPTTQFAFKPGQVLVTLRAQGVLMMTSGRMRLNLQEFRQPVMYPQAYAQELPTGPR